MNKYSLNVFFYISTLKKFTKTCNAFQARIKNISKYFIFSIDKKIVLVYY